MKRIPLHSHHVDRGAKMVPFAGFEMPLQYVGIKEEHRAVRHDVGLFDVSHMGELFFRGPDAVEAVDGLTTNDFRECEIGQAVYSALCHPNGGIVDDLIVYKLSDDEALMCVNASNREKDFAHVNAHVRGDVKVDNESDGWVQLALQGPRAASVLSQVCDLDLSEIEYYHGKFGKVGGADAFVSRTGYTGEDGFEIYAHNEVGDTIFETLFWVEPELQLCGLGCRDTLRLESKYLLYGNDMDDDTNPFEAGIGWTVKLDKATSFVGQESLREAKGSVGRRLRTFELTGRGVLRPGYDVYVDGTCVGKLTSGGFAPHLDKSIGLGYVDVEFAKARDVEIEIRGRRVAAKMGTKPFYKREK